MSTVEHHTHLLVAKSTDEWFLANGHCHRSADARMKGCFLIPLLFLLVVSTCGLSQGFCFSKNAYGIGKKSSSMEASSESSETSTVSILSKQKVIGGGYYHRVSKYIERMNAL